MQKIDLFVRRSLEWMPIFLGVIPVLIVLALAVGFLCPQVIWLSHMILALAVVLVVYICILPRVAEARFGGLEKTRAAPSTAAKIDQSK